MNAIIWISGYLLLVVCVCSLFRINKRDEG